LTKPSLSIALVAYIIAAPSLARAEPFKLTPQVVVSGALISGKDRLIKEAQFRKAELPVFQALGVFDPVFTGIGEYQIDRADALSGISNEEDKYLKWGFGFKKKFRTGSTLNVDYLRNQRKSVFGSTTFLATSSQAYLDQIQFSVKQELSGNFFGIVDRALLSAEQARYEAASLEYEENIEKIALESLDLFWKAYIAKESLKESLDARTTLERLVKTIEKKRRFGFADLGDLSRSKAELKIQNQNVKKNSQAYLSSIDLVFEAMHQDVPDEISFEVSSELPPPPEEKFPETVDGLRRIQISREALDAASIERDAAQFSSLPEVALKGSATYVGVEEDPGSSVSEMLGWTKPIYVVGLELKFALDSDTIRAGRVAREIGYDESLAQYSKTRKHLVNEIQNNYRNVTSTYQIALEALEVVSLREKVVKSQEQSYRQGRIDLSVLIQDYNSYFHANTQRATAFGNYHIALNQYAATVDQLRTVKK